MSLTKQYANVIGMLAQQFTSSKLLSGFYVCKERKPTRIKQETRIKRTSELGQKNDISGLTGLNVTKLSSANCTCVQFEPLFSCVSSCKFCIRALLHPDQTPDSIWHPPHWISCAILFVEANKTRRGRPRKTRSSDDRTSFVGTYAN